MVFWFIFLTSTVFILRSFAEQPLTKNSCHGKVLPRGLTRLVVDSHIKNGNLILNFKHKPTAGRIALERQAGRKTINPTGIQTTDLPIQCQMH